MFCYAVPEKSAQQISENISNELNSHYQGHLKSYYKDVSEDKLSIVPCDQFINLALVDKNGDSSHKNATAKPGNVDKMAAYETPVNLDALVMPDSQFILVEGPPGVGKSTLCCELCRKWDTMKSLQRFKLILRLKLRDKTIQNATSLNEIFCLGNRRFCQKIKLQNVVDEVLHWEGEGVLLIFDGFDEVPSSIVNDKGSLIMELISGKCMSKAARLVTSRPSALPQRKFPKDYRHVEILGFTDDSKIKFAEIAFKSEPDIFLLFKKFIFSNPIINSLMYIPLNCAILAQIFREVKWSQKLIPKTMTQLYTTLVLVLIRKHMIDNGEWDEDKVIPERLKKLPEDIFSNLKRVSELAYKGLLEEIHEFSANDVGDDFDHLGLLTTSKQMYLTGPKISYSFFHFSMQEFLAAFHVSVKSDLIMHQQMFLLHILEFHKNAYLKFLAGMVNLTELLPARSVLTDVVILHCLFEAQSQSAFNILDFDQQDVDLFNSLDVYAFGYVLVHAPINWEVSIYPSDFEALLSSLTHHARSQNEILGSITCLTLKGEANSHSFPEIKYLPERICQSIDYLNFTVTKKSSNIDRFNPGVVALQNLSTIDMTFRDCFELTSQGEANLSDVFIKNKTLDNVNIFFYAKKNERIGSILRCNSTNTSIIKSVLSCSTVKSFTTNAPFLTSKLPSNLKHLELVITTREWSPNQCYMYTTVEVNNCMFCIADLCKLTAVLKSVRLTEKSKTLRGWEEWKPSLFNHSYYFFSPPPQIYCNFLSILNNSLLCNSAIETLELNFCNFKALNNFNPLSQALRKDANTLCSNIRRSKSLSDLIVPFVPKIISLPKRYMRKLKRLRKSKLFSVSKSYSCPDLLELQSLHTLHPLLHKNLYGNI